MFEDRTYEALMNEKLERVPNKYDKREGSIIFDALAPNSAEDAQMYIAMNWMYDQQHGDTANRENLIRIAKDTRGIEPYPATYAILKATFDAYVPIGARFSHNELNYVVEDVLSDGTYKVRCETIGTAGNKYLGQLIPINYIKDLTDAQLVEILIYGEDEEDTEAFRARWRKAFHGIEFGGNKASYIRTINEINGVGGVKVDRATNAAGEKVGGYVRCTIISSNYDVPSDELVDAVQTIIDPEVNAGDGDGLAPIGAVATIVPVKGVNIDITTTLTYDTGYSYEAVKSKLESAIETYFKELRKGWEDNRQNNTTVRIARIDSALLNVDGVIDVADTMLNGIAENVILDAYSIPIRGALNG